MMAGMDVDATQTVLRWVDAWQRCDIDALLGYLTPDATYVSAHAGPITRLDRQFKVGCFLWERASTEGFRIDGAEQADRLAVVHGRFDFDGVARGGTAVAFPAVVTFVLRLTEEGWRIMRYHESALPR